jgi:nucleotide-binding universal stress UspA family protein
LLKTINARPRKAPSTRVVADRPGRESELLMSERIADLVSGVPVSPLRPVLVPVDFSSCSKQALLWAARLASFARAPLTVLHVIHETGSQAGFYRKRGAMTKVLQPIECIAEDILREFVDEVFTEADSWPDTEVRRTLVSGLPATRIIEVAAQQDAGLIVMGTHGRSGLSRLATGSVAARVMTHASVPVTIVKQGRGAETFLSEAPVWWKRLQLVGSEQPARDLPQEPVAG